MRTQNGRSQVAVDLNSTKSYKATKSGDVLPRVCIGDGCLAEPAPGNDFCFRCIRSKNRPVRDYHAKIENNAERLARRLAARLRPRLYAVAFDQNVKFGITTDVRSRLSQLQTSTPIELKLLGHVGCDRQLERDVHVLCAAQAVRGEWFRREGTALEVERLIVADNVLAIYRMVGREPDWMR